VPEISKPSWFKHAIQNAKDATGFGSPEHGSNDFCGVWINPCQAINPPYAAWTEQASLEANSQAQSEVLSTWLEGFSKSICVQGVL
jgi:hypothetical protein